MKYFWAFALFFLGNVEGMDIGMKVNVQDYFEKYGYVKNGQKFTASNVEIFQAFAGLPRTGILDMATLQLIQRPRCNLADPVDQFIRRYKDELNLKVNFRSRRFAIRQDTWQPTFDKKGKNVLRWVLLNEAYTVPYRDVQSVMRQSFNYWSEVTNLDFVEVAISDLDTPGNERDNIEILVSFERLTHQDEFEFDGRGGTLAHAFYPLDNTGLAGDIHFDDDEEFGINDAARTKRDLLWVAVHEIGHSIGLQHSQAANAVMRAWYPGYMPGFKLDADDILGAQEIYGKRPEPVPLTPNPLTKTTTTTTSTTTTTTTTPTTPKWKPKKGYCPAGSLGITAILYSDKYGQLFVFTENDKMLFLGYSRVIPSVNRRSYYFTQGKIDAVFEMKYRIKSGETKKTVQVMFAGKTYYIYDNFRRVSGPHVYHGQSRNNPLRFNFPNSVEKIDAATTWHKGSKRTYIFVGGEYYRYDSQRTRIDRNYPKPIKGNWLNLPERFDAAYSSHFKDETTLISGKKVYTYDIRNLKVKSIQTIPQYLDCLI